MVTLLLFISCAEEKQIMITDDEAVSLLLDLSIAKVAKDKYPTGLRDSVARAYKSQISDMHGLEEAELDTVLWMLQTDFDRYNVLYSRLVDTLKRLENELGSGNDKPLVPYDQMIDSIEAKKKL